MALRKNPRAAANKARKAGDWMTAAALYEQLGELHAALDCGEKGASYLVCAQLVLQTSRSDHSPEKDPDRRFQSAGKLPSYAQAAGLV